ncbi:PREDICTED: rab5 GDP/GTP exchange factor-like [Nanorana parkeri]|uniref:rab5 GDP/GTP exchange factor-like n=1 Tax=Nanorana parkeri TaxID=125878 RepID=UPI000854E1C7|nr:PREDICTED: rab5 GDP/GTP exchange factor-like [Nanorana parkeri]
MSSVSPGQEHVPFTHGQNLPLMHNDYVTFQFQGLVYNPEICRKNCGFYGNPAWHGYCSRCWIQKRQQTPQLTNGFRHHSTHLLCQPDMGAGYQQDINVHRKPYARPQNEDHSAKASVHPLFNSCLLSLGQGSFSDFLKALHRPDAQELLTHFINFIQRVQNANNLTVDKKAEDVQNLYKQIGAHIPDTSEEKDQLLDNIEKLVMTRLYKSVFSMDGPHEEQKDLSLQNHIRSLSWVTPKILQFSLCEHDDEVNDHIVSAVTALLEMDSKRAPQDKLACVTKSCDHLFKAIDVSTKEPATTDDLISGLIYITIKANPPHLLTNLKYITRFCNPRRLMTGKCAYWFTTFCSASSYIETMNFKSLGLTEAEIIHIIQQTSKACDSSGSIIQGTVQKMEENKQRLADLQHRQEILIQKAECLRREIKAWPVALQGEVQEILHKFPLVTKHQTN